VEALVRWPHGNGDPVRADQLVQIAEARGLVSPLRRVVLHQAARVVAALPAPTMLWLNASVHDLDQPGFVDEVLAELDAAALPVERLGLEVTETALMREPDHVIAALDRFRALGSRVALDDFGAGFCSLDRIRQLPIDVIKISPQLLLGAAGDDHASAIFSVAASLGQSLGLVVVAEGVETPAELALARRAGVSRVQGYALSPPVAAADLASGMARAERTIRSSALAPAA
jgi:EAL domain-containing protein (putative c-di-GMP-specific phosphodiesterase class I)